MPEVGAVRRGHYETSCDFGLRCAIRSRGVGGAVGKELQVVRAVFSEPLKPARMSRVSIAFWNSQQFEDVPGINFWTRRC